MLLKPRMLVFVIVTGFVLLGAITGLIIGVAGLLGMRWGYALIGFGVFALCWWIKQQMEKHDGRVRAFIHRQ